MISQIEGTVESVLENGIVLRNGGVCYEIYVPAAILKSYDGKLARESRISLITYHYYQTDPSRSIPILIGFSNRVEKEFFEKFITVSGVGPKAAVRALSLPIGDIAHAIDAGDLAYLKSLPGIGEQRAKDIIAKLQGKMGKFGLIQPSASGSRPADRGAEAREEAVEVLLQLQYKKEEARDMVRRALQRKPSLGTSEEILNEVYQQKRTR